MLFSGVQPVTRQNTISLALGILVRCHPVILWSVVSVSRVRTLITLTSPTVVIMTKIVQIAQVSATLYCANNITLIGQPVVVTTIIQMAQVSATCGRVNSATQTDQPKFACAFAS